MEQLDNSDIWSDQINNGELKEAINLFIWRWGHPELTLAQAEKIAVTTFDLLAEQPTDKVTKVVVNFPPHKTND